MKISIRGWTTKNKKVERDSVKYATKLFPKLLSKKTLRKIKKIHLTFFKHDLEDWVDGYRWLVQGDEVEIVITRKYKKNLRWLIAHELAHAEQIASKQLSKSTLTPKYRGKSYRWIGNQYRQGYLCKENGKFYNTYKASVPFELAANKRATNAVKWVR